MGGRVLELERIRSGNQEDKIRYCLSAARTVTFFIEHEKHLVFVRD